MKVGLLGFGTIGRGVFQLLQSLKERYNVELVNVFDLPIKKEVLGDLLVTNIDDIINNEDIDVVIEVLGGHDMAYNAIKKSLINNKSVITANKEVVSQHLEEFIELAHENNVDFLFEASVGGGIPIIKSLIDNVKINDVDHIYGILNGTTNYILTKMQKEGLSFEDALQLAKNNGFAEANPTADLEGLDMVRKINILASLAYQAKFSNEDIYNFGISNITKEIIDDVASKGYILKLVAQSIRNNDGVSIIVEPVLIDNFHPLAAVNDEFNAVIFKGSTNDVLEFYGKGAGSLPTATAIIADLVSIIENRGYIDFKPVNTYSVNKAFEEDSFYVFENGKGTVIKTSSRDDLKTKKFYARIVK